MEFKLTTAHQHSARCRDGRRRSFILYFINDVLVLKHKSPYNNNYDKGYDHRTHIFDCYYENGSIHQKRQFSSTWCGETRSMVPSKIREVRFPVKRTVLKDLNIPKDIKIYASKRYPTDAI